MPSEFWSIVRFALPPPKFAGIEFDPLTVDGDEIALCPAGHGDGEAFAAYLTDEALIDERLLVEQTTYVGPEVIPAESDLW